MGPERWLPDTILEKSLMGVGSQDKIFIVNENFGTRGQGRGRGVGVKERGSCGGHAMLAIHIMFTLGRSPRLLTGISDSLFYHQLKPT